MRKALTRYSKTVRARPQRLRIHKITSTAGETALKMNTEAKLLTGNSGYDLVIPSNQFLQCDVRMRQAKQNSHAPFGGLALNVCGDFMQLPPVDRDGTRKSVAECGVSLYPILLSIR